MEKQVIKFWAAWCGPCNEYGPIFERVKQDLQDVFTFKEVNVQQDPDNLAGDYKVRGIPCTVIVQDGKIVKSQSGKMSEQQLKSFILN